MTNPKVALLSFYMPNYQKLADITNPICKEYCDKQNYRFIEKIGPYCNQQGIYYSWDRLIFLRDILFNPEMGYDLDIVLVRNLSSVITNHNTRIEEIIDKNYSFHFCSDCHGPNMGQFIVKKSDWLKTFLDYWITLEPDYRNDGWQEQRAYMNIWQRPEWICQCKEYPQNLFNSYKYHELYNIEREDGEFKPGDFILHTPGTSLEQRIQLFSSDKVKSQIIR